MDIDLKAMVFGVIAFAFIYFTPPVQAQWDQGQYFPDHWTEFDIWQYRSIQKWQRARSYTETKTYSTEGMGSSWGRYTNNPYVPQGEGGSMSTDNSTTTYQMTQGQSEDNSQNSTTNQNGEGDNTTNTTTNTTTTNNGVSNENN